MRTTRNFQLENPKVFKQHLLQWAQQFEEICWLDSNRQHSQYSRYDAVLAVDAFTVLQTDANQGFEKLQEYQGRSGDWLFGYLSYDLKNDVENLSSQNFDGLGFPDLYFFQPKRLFLLKDNQLEMRYLNVVSDELEQDFQDILQQEIPLEKTIEKNDQISIKSRISKSDYLDKITQLLAHIHRGNSYEINFCQEFFAEDTEIQPLPTFKQLNKISEAPFAAFFKNEDDFLLSASPERYLQKTGKQLISQPIKGTAARSKNKGEDQNWAERLQNDPKERAENIMIVDLVRNDLSKIAEKASVEVEELCGLYSFKQVHQLISTVKSNLAPGISAVEALKSSFPMGSMTGCPKPRALKLIEELEESKRGLYSGAVGYFDPEGDFDFNVVIRSILYNRQRRYVSFSVGGAITARSIPEKEYSECMLKAAAMFQVLGLENPLVN